MIVRIDTPLSHKQSRKGAVTAKIIKTLAHDLFSTEMLLYIFFGAGTAIIDYVSEIILYQTLPFQSHATVVVAANCVSFILSVAFAFVTNKKFVFKSKKETRKELILEAVKFFATRSVSFIISLFGMVILVDSLGYSNALSKIGVSVFVVIFNYIFSKLLIFPNSRTDANKQKEKQEE